MTRLIITVLFIAMSQVSFAGTYALKFQRVSAFNQQQVCQRFVDETVTEFVNQSGASVIDFGCQENDHTFRGWDAVITYQSSTPVVRTSNYTASVYSGAFYSNYEECNKHLPLQKEIFAKATELKPLSAYCMLDVGSLNKMWETRVDGLGEGRLKADVAGLLFFGTLVDTKAVLAQYQVAAASYGMTLFEAGVNSGTGRHIVLRIYADQSYSLNNYDDMRYESVEACATAALKVSAFMKSADKPVTTFCEMTSNGGRSTLHVTNFVETLKPIDVFKANALTTRFTSMAECQKAAETLTTTAHDIFGASCAGVDHAFHVYLFTRP